MSNANSISSSTSQYPVAFTQSEHQAPAGHGNGHSSGSASPTPSLLIEAPRPRRAAGPGTAALANVLRAMVCCPSPRRRPATPHRSSQDYGATGQTDRTTSATSIYSASSTGEQTDQLVALVVKDVIDGIERWDHARSEDVSRYGAECKDDNRIMALFMDALYRHHFNQIFGTEKIPPEEKLDEIFNKIIEQVRERKDRLVVDFDVMEALLDPASEFRFLPKMAETFDVLHKQFDSVSVLKDIPRDHRWRLLIDPAKLDVLARHGINCHNPLLGFLFDGFPLGGGGYANRLAKAWIATMGNVQDGPVTVEKAIDILSVARGADEHIALDGMKFGAYCSRDGLLRIGDFMCSLKEQHDYKTELRIDADMWFRQDAAGMAIKFQRRQNLDGTDDTEEKLLKTASTVRELLEQEDFGPKPRRVFYFRRYPTEGCTRNEESEKLTAVVSTFLEATRNIEELRPDEALRVIARTYLDCEFLHAMKDANYRLWGLLVPNLLLAKAGQPMSVMSNASISDGSSIDEVIDLIKAGQQWMAGHADA